MDELIKCMLSISARLSPYNGTSGVVDMRTTASHGLAIRFHVTLPKDIRTTSSLYAIGELPKLKTELIAR